MNESSARYLSLLQTHLIKNNVAIVIILFIEYIPILYHIMLASFSLSNYSIPSYYAKYHEYLSYNEWIMINLFQSSAYYIILICVLFVFYVVYKYYLINVNTIATCKAFNLAIINVYEYLLFRLLFILILNIEVKQIKLGSLTMKIISTLLFVIIASGISLHYKSHYIYISIDHEKKCFYENRLFLIFNYYILMIKGIISLQTYFKEPLVAKFWNVAIYTLNLVLILHETVIIMKNKFCYLTSESYIILQFIFTYSLGFLQIYFLIQDCQSSFFFIFGIIASLFFSIPLYVMMLKISHDKMVSVKNPIGTLIYLIKETYSFDLHSYDELYTLLSNSHRAKCKDKECKLCHSESENSINEEKEKCSMFEKIFTFAYKSLIKKNKGLDEYNKYEIKEAISYYLLINLYFDYLSKKKNIVKIVLKYQNIKMKIKNSAIYFNGGNSVYVNLFSLNYLINLDYLYEQINKRLFNLNDEQKQAYLIEINKYVRIIKNLFDEILLFFEIDIKTPQEIIKLGKKYLSLQSSINYKEINSKEIKYNYPCIVCGYIIEEIFNDQKVSGIFNKHNILNFDELLESHFNEDKIIFSIYDIVKKTIIVQQCSKDMMFLKNKSLDEIFPYYLRKDGMSMVINAFSQNAVNYFEYYCRRFRKETIEILKLKFTNIPLFEKNNYTIYIICNYKIDKENIGVFENKKINGVTKSILVGVSESMANFFKISPSDITNSINNHHYIEASDIFYPQSGVVNYKALQECLIKKIGLKKMKLSTKSLIFILKEKIGNLDIYVVRENSRNLSITTKNTNLTLCMRPSMNEIAQEFNQQDYLYHYEQHTTQTNFSSSTLTNTISSINSKKILSKKQLEEIKFRKFVFYKYYILLLNILSAIILVIFVIFEVKSIVFLNKTFDVIIHFNEFQEYFYHTSLSIFSLACNSDSNTDSTCINQFVVFSALYIHKLNLTENELFNVYIYRELLIKSDEMVNKLNIWESEKKYIHSHKLEDIFDDDFYFTTIEDNNNTLNTITITLSFEDAIKRYSNNIIQIASSPYFITSPVYVITSNGRDNVDFTNAIIGREPNKGFMLNEVQKYYYVLILNYQKYLLILLSIGDLLKEYYDNEVNNSLRDQALFVSGLGILHIILMFLCLLFLSNFKRIHMNYFVKIYEQISDPSFLPFYRARISFLQTLLEMYKEDPVQIIKEMQKLDRDEKEKKRINAKNNIKLLKEEPNKEKKKEMLNPNINYQKLQSIYNQKITKSISLRVIFLFGIYVVFILCLFIGIINRHDNLILMNRYIKNNFDMSINTYINIGLIQIMSLTNQTDHQLHEYFNDQDSSEYQSEGFVKERLEESLSLIFEIYQMEKKYNLFDSLSDVLTIQCASIYNNFKDSMITSVVEQYPNSDYELMFSRYCFSLSTLSKYNDDKLTMTVIAYQNQKLLDFFTDQTYETYAKINNNEILYTVYIELLIMIRPIRGYIFRNCLQKNVDSITNDYLVYIIIFLVVNFLFEIVFFIMIKFSIIDKIIRYSKEILLVVKAFHCV